MNRWTPSSGDYPRQARWDGKPLTIWLALRNTTVDWGRAAKEWREAMNQFAILYEERVTAAAHAGR
jgi:hypothetical protein